MVKSDCFILYEMYKNILILFNLHPLFHPMKELGTDELELFELQMEHLYGQSTINRTKGEFYK